MSLIQLPVQACNKRQIAPSINHTPPTTPWNQGHTTSLTWYPLPPWPPAAKPGTPQLTACLHRLMPNAAYYAQHGYAMPTYDRGAVHPGMMASTPRSTSRGPLESLYGMYSSIGASPEKKGSPEQLDALQSLNVISQILCDSSSVRLWALHVDPRTREMSALTCPVN